jgi:hypothetical protein
MVLEDGTFEKYLGHEGRAYMNGISALIEEVKERPLGSFHHVRTQLEDTIYEPSNTESVLIMDISVSKTVRNKFLLFISYPLYSTLLQ